MCESTQEADEREDKHENERQSGKALQDAEWLMPQVRGEASATLDVALPFAISRSASIFVAPSTHVSSSSIGLRVCAQRTLICRRSILLWRSAGVAIRLAQHQSDHHRTVVTGGANDDARMPQRAAEWDGVVEIEKHAA